MTTYLGARDNMPASLPRKLKGERFHYVVEGRYRFPIDMLRYDAAWPADQLSAGVMTTHLCSETPPEGKIRLSLTSDRLPTFDRWASFGWKVVEVR